MASCVRFMRLGARSSASMLREVSTAMSTSSELALDFSSTYPQRGEASEMPINTTALAINPARSQYSQVGISAVSWRTRSLLINRPTTRSRWNQAATLPPSTSNASPIPR